MKITNGTISSPFGVRHHPISNTTSRHQGVDISVPIGTPIYSPVMGTVLAIYEHGVGGRTIIIVDQKGATRFGFCHLRDFCVTANQRISRGTLIAHSGNSGKTTGPHLHFSVQQGGSVIDGKYTGGEFVDSAKFIDF